MLICPWLDIHVFVPNYDIRKNTSFTFFIEQISIPLARVFNLSLKEGVVPFEWRKANIISLFKNGSRIKLELQTSEFNEISKLLERLIKNHMVDFLVRHKLLNPSQHGFLKARSCLNVCSLIALYPVFATFQSALPWQTCSFQCHFDFPGSIQPCCNYCAKTVRSNIHLCL